MADRDEVDHVLSEQATRFATRPTPGWWDDRIRAEFRYALRELRITGDPGMVWARLERRLLVLCRNHERNEAA